MTATVFPAAAPTVQVHPSWCACRPCTDRQVAAIRQPLVLPASRVDLALDRRRR